MATSTNASCGRIVLPLQIRRAFILCILIRINIFFLKEKNQRFGSAIAFRSSCSLSHAYSDQRPLQQNSKANGDKLHFSSRVLYAENEAVVALEQNDKKSSLQNTEQKL